MMNIRECEWAAKPKYFEYWNAEEQARIDEDIEKNRKADGDFSLPEIRPGTAVHAEQLTHSFIFGAHIFNFNQLGSHEFNEKHQALYGTLFNSATAAFYWGPFEPEEGKMRFETEEHDTERYWNAHKDPKMDFFWRRPATDQIVDFCEAKKIRCHGHPLMWGNATWQYPRWMLAKLPKEVLVQLLADVRCGTNIWMRSPAQVAAACPGFAEAYLRALENRFRRIAERYGTRIQSWDICNESGKDWASGRLIPGDEICVSIYGRPLPGDYVKKAFDLAEKYLPGSVKRNINDYFVKQEYADEIQWLRGRGARIDIAGVQMHCFDPQVTLQVADGVTDHLSPAFMRDRLAPAVSTGLPVHLSEITIATPSTDARGEAAQALIAGNLYRLWFSTGALMGITWWNTVDDCGAPQEPSLSGLFHRDMTPKPSAKVLSHLIREVWHTSCDVKAGDGGTVRFRGFRGTYRLSWKDADGKECSRLVTLN